MAPKTGDPRGKKKNIQVAATKAVEKNKTCHRLPKPALDTPGHSLTPGGHKKKKLTRSVKAMLHFPVYQIRRYLKEGRYSQRVGFAASVYLTGVLEYVTNEVLEIAGQAANDSKKSHIIPRHVMLGIMHDEDLIKLLASVTIGHGGVLPNIHKSLLGDGNGTTEDATNLPVEDAAKSSDKIMESP